MAQAPARQSMRERMREQAEKASSNGPRYIKVPDGVKVSFFQPKEAEFELDFIPYEVTTDHHPKGMKPGDLWAQRSIKVHYGIGADESAYICLKTIGKKCPICEDRADMANDPNADEKLIKDLAPKDRAIYQLIDLNDEKKGIQIWDYSYHLFEKRLMNDITKTENAAGGRKRSTPHGGFSDLVGGQTLTVSFIEKKMGQNKFFECDRIDAVDRDDYDDFILDEALDLDAIIEILSYDKLKAIYLAVDEKDVKKPADGGEAPSRRRGQAEEPPDDTPPARRRGRSEEPPADEPAPEPTGRARRGRTEEPPVDEPAPTGRRGRGANTEPAAEEPPPTRRGRGAAAEPAEEPPPARRSRGAAAEPAEDAPASNRPRRGAAPATPPCLAKGVFGADTDKHDQCYDCPNEIYDACLALKIENEGA